MPNRRRDVSSDDSAELPKYIFPKKTQKVKKRQAPDSDSDVVEIVERPAPSTKPVAKKPRTAPASREDLDDNDVTVQDETVDRPASSTKSVSKKRRAEPASREDIDDNDTALQDVPSTPPRKTAAPSASPVTSNKRIRKPSQKAVYMANNKESDSDDAATPPPPSSAKKVKVKVEKVTPPRNTQKIGSSVSPEVTPVAKSEVKRESESWVSWTSESEKTPRADKKYPVNDRNAVPSVSSNPKKKATPKAAHESSEEDNNPTPIANKQIKKSKAVVSDDNDAIVPLRLASPFAGPSTKTPTKKTIVEVVIEKKASAAQSVSDTDSDDARDYKSKRAAVKEGKKTTTMSTTRHNVPEAKTSASTVIEDDLLDLKKVVIYPELKKGQGPATVFHFVHNPHVLDGTSNNLLNLKIVKTLDINEARSFMRALQFTHHGIVTNPSRSDLDCVFVHKGAVLDTKTRSNALLIFTGAVAACSLYQPEVYGNNRSRAISLFPIKGEYNQFLRWMACVFETERFTAHIVNRVVSFCTKKEGAATFDSTPNRSPKKNSKFFADSDSEETDNNGTQQKPKVVVRTSFKVMLFTDMVPIFDARGAENFSFKWSLADIQKLPLFESDLPDYAMVTVAYTMSTYAYQGDSSNGVTTGVGTNIQFVVLHGLSPA